MHFLAIPSLRWRLVAVTCLAYIIVAAVTSVASYRVQKSNLHNQLVRQAKSDATLLAAASITPLSTSGNPTQLKSQLQGVLQTLPLQSQGVEYAFVTSTDGSVASFGHTTGHYFMPRFGDIVKVVQLSGGRIEAFRAVYQTDVGTPLGYAAVVLSSKQIQSDLQQSVLVDLVLRGVGLLIFILLSLVIARYLLGPLAVLSRAAGAIRGGQLSARVAVGGGTELETVGEAFNDMATALEQRIMHLSFLADAGAVLPNTFREAGDLNRVLFEFCDRLDACGVCLVFADPSGGTNIYYSKDPNRTAWQAAALTFGERMERMTVPTTGIQDGYALMVVPVVNEATFLAVRAGGRPFSGEEQQVITNFAYQFGIAADNARLFDAQQEALRVKDQFLSIVSHELRTPLTTIKGYAQMLRRRLASDPQGVRFAETIDAQVGRLTRLVDDLLDVTRFARGQFELRQQRLDLLPLLDDVLSRFRLVAPNHRLELRVDGAAPVGYWDHDRLEQVMNNLVGNAIKYSPNGGAITVSVHCRDDEVVVSVRDQGIGIPEEDQHRLFERFFRGSAEGQDVKGMGLGLYVTKRIVEAHGGTISLHSKPDEGSEFCFTLPLVRQPAVVD